MQTAALARRPALDFPPHSPVPGAHRVDGLSVPGRLLRVARDQDVYVEGSSRDYVYQVISGAVRTCKLMADGRRHVGEFALPGDLFGLDGMDEHFYTAEAIVETQLVCYSRRMLDDVARRDHRTALVLQQVALRSLALAQKRVVLLGRKTALERVASFLLEMHERSSEPRGFFGLIMSRYDIADHLGLTVETVSRALTSLKQRRVVDLSATHRIRVIDLPALESLSGEGGTATH